VPSATVRDVETGAWTPGAAVSEQPWTAVRPTIYCSLDTLPDVAAAGWQGDVWVADYGEPPVTPTAPPAVPAGMTCVAVQWSDQGGGGAYDLSVVFDPTWPYQATGDDMLIIQGASGAVYLLSGGRLHHIIDPTSLASYKAAGIQEATVTQAEETQLLADFPVGNPPVTVTVAAGS
jgi:hypothetical protein